MTRFQVGLGILETRQGPSTVDPIDRVYNPLRRVESKV